MPIATRTARAFAAACLVVVTLLASFPAPAAALQPPRPLPGYRAHFVTQTDRRPMTNCLWASASMLLDKWTNGEVRIGHQALREKSGDRVGGSSFDELKVAYAKLGFDLEFSPDGGARITFWQMLARLRKGAGAIVLGDYHDLPRYFGRWDRKFWKKKGKKDNHAVYVERYDRARGRVWLMDPLARGDWKGEWISIWALRRFAWTSGGYLYTAMTPTAKAAPFAKVKATKPKAVLSPTGLDASWTVKAPKGWRYPGATAKVEFERAADPLLAAAVSPALPVKAAADDVPVERAVTMRGKTLHVTSPLPDTPGAYVATLAAQDKRFGRSFVTADDLAVFVPGDRRATLRLNVRHAGVEAGSVLKVTVNVANTGTETWADTRASDAAGGKEPVERGTRAEARWILLEAAEPDDDGTDGDGTAAAPDPGEPVVLDLVPLAPGKLVVVRGTVVVPDALGTWALVVDIVDDLEGSFAALGSAPAVAVVDVVAARGRAPVE